MGFCKRLIVAGLALTVAWTACTALAMGKTFKPTRTDDPNPGKCKLSDCSLREAVNAANKREGEDKIVLGAGKRYNLRRNPSALAVEDGTVINSSARPRATIDANRNGGVFSVFSFLDEPPLVLNRIVVTGANASDGAIEGDVIALNRSIVRGNRGEGIDAGFLKMTRSTLTRNMEGGAFVDRGIDIVRSKIVENTSPFNGGGLLVGAPDDPTSTMSIKKSTIANNRSASFGGGIFTAAESVAVSQSTISGNRAQAGGGGVAVFSADLGGDFYSAGFAITNSTVANNRARGFGGGIDSFHALDQDPPTTVISSTTIAYNLANSDGVGGEGGGGVQDGDADITTRHSLIARNTVGAGGFAPDCNGDIGSFGDNLIGNDDGCVTSISDLRGVAKIAQLRRNGGPTKTIALKAGSQAINNGTSATCPPRDQRGVRRQLCDIGAFERR